MSAIIQFATLLAEFSRKTFFLERTIFGVDLLEKAVSSHSIPTMVTFQAFRIRTHNNVCIVSKRISLMGHCLASTSSLDVLIGNYVSIPKFCFIYWF